MDWSYNDIMQRFREALSSLFGPDKCQSMFVDWEVQKACMTFDTTGNVAPGPILVMLANTSGGPVYVSGESESTETLLARLSALGSRNLIPAQYLSISYALHLHCL